jgi:hypothetical protein
MSSIKGFLAQLDLEHLQIASNEADRLIKEKTSTPLKTVWCVEDAFCTLKSFGSYLNAATFLYEHAKENLAAGMPLRARDMELSMVSRKVPEDEYAQWIDDAVGIEPSGAEACR